MKKYIQAIGVWILIIPLAILNGGLREYVLSPMGAIALPLSGIVLSGCIFLTALWLIPKIKDCSRSDYYFMGLMWFVLTNLFDLSMYISEGGGFADLIGSYNFLTGNLWVVVTLTTLVAPALAAKIRKL